MIDNTSGKYLFHGTGMYCLASILSQNTLFEGAHWGKEGEPHGPRFSVNSKVAEDFILNNTWWGEGGILVLDREKLALDYLLVPYVDEVVGEPKEYEREIVAVTPSIQSLDKYLVAVLVDPAFIDAMASGYVMEMAWSEGGWPDWVPQGDEGVDQMKALLSSLKDHQKLNIIGADSDIPRFGNLTPALLGYTI